MLWRQQNWKGLKRVARCQKLSVLGSRFVTCLHMVSVWGRVRRMALDIIQLREVFFH